MPRRAIKTFPADLARQRDVLEPLFLARKADEEAQGREFGYTEGGYESGMSYDSFRRYVTGITLMPTTYYEGMARTLRVSLATLRDALIPIHDAADQDEPWNAPGWTFRGHLHGKVPIEDIERFADEHEGKPLANQYSAAEGILRLAAEQIDRTRSIS